VIEELLVKALVEYEERYFLTVEKESQITIKFVLINLT
jgi:hypothetical protein